MARHVDLVSLRIDTVGSHKIPHVFHLPNLDAVF